MISINRVVSKTIINHVENTYPEEGCGGLIGTDSRIRKVEEAVPLRNRITESRHNRYVIDAQDILLVENNAKKKGLDLLGFFHSHPNAPANPSVFDLEHSWPWYSYIIISVKEGKATDKISWKLKNDRSKFDMEELLEIE